MKRSSADLRRALLASQTQPVRLVVAASLVYHQLVGRRQLLQAEGGYQRVLDSTALAISQVADIYYVNLHKRLMRIPEEELAAGTFEHGAEVFRTPLQRYTELSVRRADLMDAIEILRKAHAAIGAPKNRPRA